MKRLLLSLLIMAGCEPDFARVGRTSEDREYLPVVQKTFPHRSKSILRGLELRDVLKNGASPTCSPGDDVIFFGAGAPSGGNADLLVESGLKVIVTVQPAKDVRPVAAMWMACVRGELESVDVANKTIRIVAKPENWYAIETW